MLQTLARRKRRRKWRDSDDDFSLPGGIFPADRRISVAPTDGWRKIGFGLLVMLWGGGLYLRLVVPRVRVIIPCFKRTNFPEGPLN